MSRERRSGSRKAADPAIADLLDTVREVRTTLAVDLSTAAGALDDARPEVARDILAAASAELQLVASRTIELDDAHEEARPRRFRKKRALLALPAVPLVGAIAMTTAAAMNGTPAKPAAVHHVVATSTPTHTAAGTTLQRLEHVVTHHPQAAQVMAVANDLHEQLTRMIATSNPAQLHVVRQLLTLEQQVLESSKVPGTQLALAASRAIAELLEHRPARAHSGQPTTTSTAVAKTPAPRSTPSATATPTHRQRAPQQHESASTTRTSPSSKPTNPLFGAGLFNGS